VDRVCAIIYIRLFAWRRMEHCKVKKPLGFIERHGLWTDEQRRQAEEVKGRVEKDDLHLVRLAWADPHGASRAKAVTLPAFAAALTTGYNINVATSTLDSAGARTFSSVAAWGCPK
jgi:glutamine synthetase